VSCGSGGSCGSRASDAAEQGSCGCGVPAGALPACSLPADALSAAGLVAEPGLIQIDRGPRRGPPPRGLAAPAMFEPVDAYPHGLMIGLDVGSTTVKFVVIDPLRDTILLQDYQRHDTRQPEKTLDMLHAIERAYPHVPHSAFRVFATGSGGAPIARHLGAKFVQEVNAVSLAVEHLFPDVQSVIELGGQDAKIIIFKPDDTGGAERAPGKKKKIPSMNDKCAGGTGAVIDKITAKLQIESHRLCEMGYTGLRLHPVAGKCGVFAETDINGLQKQGVPPAELMASLFESIVMQNLSVLTRGHTLKPRVLLLGGPNCYIAGMRECWRHHLALLWRERHVALPDGVPVEDLVIVPEHAQYFAAIGAVRFGMAEVEDQPDAGAYAGASALQWYVDVGRGEEKQRGGAASLVRDDQDLARFRERYRPEPWIAPAIAAGTVVEAFLGLDGGSTSTKAVLLDRDKRVIAKAYQLSKGNPIEDTMDVLRDLDAHVTRQGARLSILGAGTTGYAKDILKDVIGADVALVETVAHTESGLHFYPGTDVIVDVGGQDIKLIVLKNGRVKDFKLNTQCSAGNGYFLQSTAAAFGYDVRDFADAAFSARAMPTFGYGCAVFMQSDIVDFQRQGWTPAEIMAGLAAVLPKNIWLYVAQVPNLAKLGRRFVLQGGTQHNLAAVKSQVDFIESRFLGTATVPDVIVHQHCGEAGAIGCALEAHRLVIEQGSRTSFIGLDRIREIAFRTTRTEETRCYFCKNKCLRTFIDVQSGTAGTAAAAPLATSRVPLREGERRLIVATCEKGTVEDLDAMREIKLGLDAAKQANPNLMQVAAHEAFQDVDIADDGDAADAVAGGRDSGGPESPLQVRHLRRQPAEARTWMSSWTKHLPAMAQTRAHRERGRQHDRDRRARRRQVRIGMPRVLNMYSHAPFFIGFFRSLGVPFQNLVFSDFTNEALYKRGAKRGSIDPCFPSKLGIPHVHDLLFVQHEKKPLTHIFFPMVDSFPTFLAGVQGSRACPTVVATPEAAHAAFIKEGDLFAARGIAFKKTFLNLDQRGLCARQMQDDWGDELDLSLEESTRATSAGLAALARFEASQRARSRALLERIAREDRLGVVVLGRPYHNDPGVNHEICDELQKLGYPVFYQDMLPIDDEVLAPLFGEEVGRGAMRSALSLDDVWKNSYSENTNRKVWAAKFTARHPNLVALELSSFKCGHDAPIYSVIEEIIERSGTPYFCFKDIDENRPAGSIKIRIETIAYFLARYRQQMLRDKARRQAIDAEVAAYEAELRLAASLSSTHVARM
jgi:activator of 2-hydroxyglutaryl-CoA dehydratase/predicted nucleotide-binding protein (sugar kinase/HSP70/actin superfamily)